MTLKDDYLEMIIGSRVPSPTFPTPNLLSFQKRSSAGAADSVVREMPANTWYKHPTSRDLEWSKPVIQKTEI